MGSTLSESACHLFRGLRSNRDRFEEIERARSKNKLPTISSTDVSTLLIAVPRRYGSRSLRQYGMPDHVVLHESKLSQHHNRNLMKLTLEYFQTFRPSPRLNCDFGSNKWHVLWLLSVEKQFDSSMPTSIPDYF